MEIEINRNGEYIATFSFTLDELNLLEKVIPQKSNFYFEILEAQRELEKLNNKGG